MTVILEGEYESEYGEVITLHDVDGENLNDIVQKIKADDADFGHTPMELNLHFPDGSIKWVEDTVARMVSES